METRKLIIIRGPSGSGKSTIANEIKDGFMGECALPIPDHEADHFFDYDTLRRYRFDTNYLHLAHKFCQLNVQRDMFHELPMIIVSNTSTTLREVETYIEMANNYSYAIDIIRTPGPWDPEILAARNIHEVPLETIKKQIDRYQPYENETEWTTKK